MRALKSKGHGVSSQPNHSIKGELGSSLYPLFNKTFSITGQPPADRVVILQFDNMDKVKAWRDAARDAQEKIGSKFATFRTFAVEGVAQY